jgi:hypothetical protein
MEARARAAKREHENAVSLAWHTAAFTGAAMNGKLKKLDHYIVRPKRVQTPEEMLAVFRQFQSRGANMTIRQVH